MPLVLWLPSGVHCHSYCSPLNQLTTSHGDRPIITHCEVTTTRWWSLEYLLSLIDGVRRGAAVWPTDAEWNIHSSDLWQRTTTYLGYLLKRGIMSFLCHCTSIINVVAALLLMLQNDPQTIPLKLGKLNWRMEELEMGHASNGTH